MLASEVFVILAVLALAVCSAFALLAMPSYLAVRRLVLRRFAAPLERGRLEHIIVLAAALAGACSSLLYVHVAPVLLVLIAPVPLGTIPWAAGELLAGESDTPGLALLSSVGVAYVLSFAGLTLELPGTLASPALGGQLATAALAALGAAEIYLGMRGEAIPAAPPEAIALERVLAEADTLANLSDQSR